jgi:fido (protein-threonine AMPylation protein)
MTVLGRWWADIPKSEWPQLPDLLKEIHADFYNDENDAWIGDRRQEIVFIGQLDQNNNQGNRVAELERALDSCLLTDNEMSEYKRICTAKGGDKALAAAFK